LVLYFWSWSWSWSYNFGVGLDLIVLVLILVLVLTFWSCFHHWFPAGSLTCVLCLVSLLMLTRNQASRPRPGPRTQRSRPRTPVLSLRTTKDQGQGRTEVMHGTSAQNVWTKRSGPSGSGSTSFRPDVLRRRAVHNFETLSPFGPRLR